MSHLEKYDKNGRVLSNILQEALFWSQRPDREMICNYSLDLPLACNYHAGPCCSVINLRRKRSMSEREHMNAKRWERKCSDGKRKGGRTENERK